MAVASGVDGASSGKVDAGTASGTTTVGKGTGGTPPANPDPDGTPGSCFRTDIDVSVVPLTGSLTVGEFRGDNQLLHGEPGERLRRGRSISLGALSSGTYAVRLLRGTYDVYCRAHSADASSTLSDAKVGRLDVP